MLKFYIIIMRFSIFTEKNSQSDMFFPKLKNTIVKIYIKSFSLWRARDFLQWIPSYILLTNKYEDQSWIYLGCFPEIIKTITDNKEKNIQNEIS